MRRLIFFLLHIVAEGQSFCSVDIIVFIYLPLIVIHISVTVSLCVNRQFTLILKVALFFSDLERIYFI